MPKRKTSPLPKVGQRKKLSAEKKDITAPLAVEETASIPSVVADYDSLNAINQEEEEQECEEIKNFNLFDNFAWLLEGSTSDCVALTVAKNKFGDCHLVVAINGVSSSSRESNKLITNLDNTILEFADVIASGEMDNDQEIDTMLRIFELKLRSAYKGLFTTSLSDANIAQLLDLIREAYRSTETSMEIPQIAIDKASSGFRKSPIQIAGAMALANRLLRRFYRFKENISKNQSLQSALKNINAGQSNQLHFIKYNQFGSVKLEDARWLTQEQGASGYGIVATHGKTQPVHAEMKLLDFLLATRAIATGEKIC